MNNGSTTPIIEITIRDIDNTDAIEAKIRKRIDKLLERYFQTVSCRVVVDFTQKRQHQGKLFNVHIQWDIPGKQFVANRKQNEDLYVAIRDTFDALERELSDFTNRRREASKIQQTGLKGVVVRLFDDYGFIQTPDGKEYYFRDQHVLDPTFNHLVVGAPVHFVINAETEESVHAHRVTLAELDYAEGS